MRTAARRLAWLGVAGGLLVPLYFFLAVLGALICHNREFRSAAGGVPIWVLSNDIHTDIVVPADDRRCSWRRTLALAGGEGRIGYEVALIGWGDRKFYLETPTWADVRLRTVLGAACGTHSAAVHVVWWRSPPAAGPRCRALALTDQQYARLCAFLLGGFRLDSAGRPQPIDHTGYTADDEFYEGQGHYNAFETCNTWAGQALAAAGVRVGVWTPFRWGVTRQLPE